jgi:hypothetical protein
MRNIVLTAMILTLAVAPLPASGQEAGAGPDAVIERYFEAIGGREKVAALRDRTSKGNLAVMGMTGTIEIREKVPNKVYTLVDVGVARLETWFDGEKGYRDDPMQGSGPMGEEELEDLRDSYVIAPLLNYRDHGWTVRSGGEGEVEGSPASIVEVVDKRERVTKYFFDRQTHVLRKVVAPIPAREGGGEQEIVVSDLREVAGVKFPFKLVRATPAMTVEVTFDSIEANTGLADDVFRRPEPEPAATASEGN